MTKEFEHLYDKFLIRQANSVYNDDFRKFLQETNPFQIWFNGKDDLDRQNEFLDFYLTWIQSSKLNSFIGLETFPYRHISLGCTQSLDEFHFKSTQQQRRIRMFRGEYPYNRDVINFNYSTDFIDDQPLQKGDAVIISCPFSASGNKHPLMDDILNKCADMEIPVAIDCAFFGTCGNIKIDLSHPAIHQVAFSTTKGLQCGNYRSGIEFSKSHDGHLAIQTDWHHGIHLNVSIGLYLMKNFSPDYNYNKYRATQEKVCKQYNIIPSSCIHLGIGNEDWNYFTRDGVYNRIGLRNAVKDMYSNDNKS